MGLNGSFCGTRVFGHWNLYSNSGARPSLPDPTQEILSCATLRRSCLLTERAR